MKRRKGRGGVLSSQRDANGSPFWSSRKTARKSQEARRWGNRGRDRWDRGAQPVSGEHQRHGQQKSRPNAEDWGAEDKADSDQQAQSLSLAQPCTWLL